jgi:hypothetical protein
MTEQRNQKELLWFQTGKAFNFITAAPHCGGQWQYHFANLSYRYLIVL